MKFTLTAPLLAAVLAASTLWPTYVEAGAVWHVGIEEVPSAASTPAPGLFSTLRLLLSGKSAVQRLPIGTTFTLNSSAYASSPYQTDSTPCITAAGTRVRPGVVASNFLPLGTILEIRGERYIVEDRMNARYDRAIDIWFPSTKEALEFGRQKVEATIVEYGTVGQEILAQAPEEELPPTKPSILVRASIKFVAITRAIARAIPANVNQYDVNCFE